MNKLILAFCLLMISSIFTFAQTDYKKYETYIGFSNNQIDTGVDSGNSIQSFFNDRRSFNGFEAAGVYNFSRYVGAKADFSGTYRRQSVNSTFNTGTGTATFNSESNRSAYNVLGGVQIKDNSSDARIKPFAHGLVGVGHQRINLRNTTCSGAVTVCPSSFVSGSDTGFSGAFGGGLDVKVSDKVDIRAVQVDYNPVWLSGARQDNVRFGIGLVIK
ncbi:MAG: hypothetical protein K1X72_07550 [Pyrinomonadaceae bacterium]|nr:hypothetical protein [Pyrinomonadaceae bacterium]